MMVAAAAGLVAMSGPPRQLRVESGSLTPNSQLVRALGKSQLPLVSDLYWIRAISVTTHQRVPADGKDLVAWCRFVTELDPHFVWPYLLGGLLGVMTLGDTHYNVPEANELLEAGLEQLPHEYRLAVYLSFNQLELQHDVSAAAQTLQRGAAAPGAPPFLAQLATRLLAQSGSFDSAKAFAEELAKSDDPLTREFFQHRLKEIERDEGLTRAQAAVGAFQLARGKPPESLLQLSLEGFLAEIPIDPLGGTVSLDPNTGLVSSTSGSRLQANQPPK